MLLSSSKANGSPWLSLEHTFLFPFPDLAMSTQATPARQVATHQLHQVRRSGACGGGALSSEGLGMEGGVMVLSSHFLAPSYPHSVARWEGAEKILDPGAR